jgi:PQQ-like domain
VTEYRKILEGEAERFDLSPGAFDRLLERQQRKARTRRVAAGATAFLVAAAGIWVATTAFRRQPSPGLPERITPANVSRLQLVWAASVGAPASTPVVTHNTVYLTAGAPGANLRLYAFPISCDSADSCRPSWYAELGPAERLTRPAVAGGRVFATGDRLHAFPALCAEDGGRCDPIWTSSTSPSARYSSPLVAGDVVYVTSGTSLDAYRASGPAGAIDPLWSGPSGGGVNPPAVGGGNAYTVAHPEGLSAFPLDCQTGTETCQPIWQASAGESDAPGVVATEQAVFATTTRLSAFASDCGSSRCDQLWFSEGIRSIRNSPPVVGDGEVYVGGDRLYAFSLECGGESCPPQWVGPEQRDPSLPEPRSWSDTAVQANMVFSSTDRPYAFPTRCGQGGSVCAPLWVGQPITGAAFTAIGVSDRVVVQTAADGSIRAFAVRSGIP